MNDKLGPEDHLPLTPLDLSVLLVLGEAASWGYGIVRAVAQRSRGRLQLAPGNVYQALDRLMARGWIRTLEPDEVPAGADARRRYYGITPEGAAAAAAEARRIRDMLPALNRVLAIEPQEEGA